MPERLVPYEMTLMDLAAVNWVLCRVKNEVLSGRPSGAVIDQALEEVVESSTAMR